MRKIIPITLFSIAVIACVVSVIYPKQEKLALAIFSVVVPSVAALISYVNYQISQDQIFKDLFREFNKRFDDLNEDLNRIVVDYSDSESEKKIIQDYLNLCCEEYLWKKKGRIPDVVWIAWRDGILYYLKESPEIKAYFEKEKRYDKSYYGFINYILNSSFIDK